MRKPGSLRHRAIKENLAEQKNFILDGKQAAHICLRLADIPNCLMPNISKAGTISPIIAPATYQGHSCFNNSIIVV
jgi:hypothetical protein